MMCALINTALQWLRSTPDSQKENTDSDGS